MQTVVLTENMTENLLQSNIQPLIEENKMLKLQIERLIKKLHSVETISYITNNNFILEVNTIVERVDEPEKKTEQSKSGRYRNVTQNVSKKDNKTKVTQNVKKAGEKAKVTQNDSTQGNKTHALGKNIQNGKILPIKLTNCKEIITKPKHPPSSFRMWVIDEYHPKLKKSTGKGQGELWKLMPEEEKNVWKEKAAAAKEQYFKDRETYIRLSYERDKQEYYCTERCTCSGAVFQ